MIGGFLLAKNVLALDVGTNEINSVIQLGASDPQTIVARIINVAMMFLGIIAVGIIIFAGFKWMTSQGNEEQIESAKKILKAGVIGLVIILASWGIAAFILNRLMGATGNGGTGNGNNNGGETLPPCSGNGCSGMTCDDNSLVPGCQFSTSSCQIGLFCSAFNNCTCQPCPPSDPNCSSNPPGSFGAACDSDITNAACDADNNMCDAGQGLTCDVNTCTCLGSPVITDISPAGGFCDNGSNISCNINDDCLSVGGDCNATAPNGAPNNIISVHGYNFGTSSTSTSFNNNYRSHSLIARIKQFFNLDVRSTKAAGLSQVVFLGNEIDPSDDQVALNPTAINPVCTDSWTNNEIIAVIPSGVASGPIKVVNGNLNSNLIDFDLTNDAVGPSIPNFVANTIVRPGICRITPEAGVLGDSVSYFGNNLSGAGYFGNEANKFKGISSTFLADNTSGYVLVPNVGAGYMSTFVVSLANQKSNYVAFRKNQEPPTPPSISGFEPETGSAGQYVTIRGNGFGNSRGVSQVFFGSAEADYNFPAVCLHSVWSDNQVIVKVPAGLSNGAYNLKMKIGSWAEISSANTFSADSTAPLLPSLCLVEPSRGPVNSLISFYGEYFSSSNTGVARFYNNQDASGAITSDENANKLMANVPIDAVTGPVKIVDNAKIGNSLNFMVGSCTNNSECNGGTPYCCPFGSPKEGQCTIALMDSTNGCYNSIPTSVFEWKFGTSMSVPCDSDLTNATCDADNAMCNSLTLECDPDSCTCQPCPESGSHCGVQPFYSCAQKGSGSNSCPTGFCPNSPGQCSAYDGLAIKDTGVSCADSVCADFSYCSFPNSCGYNSSLNRCTRVSSKVNCSLSTTTSLTFGTTTSSAIKTCRNYVPNKNRWEINISGSCPNDWFNIGNGKCADTLSTSTCGICSAGGTCVQLGAGTMCATNKICPIGSTCNSNDKCETSGAASCDCCCEIGQDARDCCAPLTCVGTCGSGSYTDTDQARSHSLGSCSGCSAVGNTPEQHDDACNCANTSGKFCNNDVCVDCTAISQESDCTDHASVCCWDDKDGICHGGNGKLISAATSTSEYGHCAFYACANTTTNQCATSFPDIYNTSTNILINHIFKNSNQCTGCTTDILILKVACALTTDSTSCKAKTGCCWDMKPIRNKCTSGNKITSGFDFGACAYYNCQTGSNSDQCAAAAPSANGIYATLSACSAGCNTPHLGASCNAVATSTQFCNVSMCGGPFACLIDSSPSPYPITITSSTVVGNCGVCCCDPTNNTCAQINPVLSCYKNKGNCSGNSRGLCCGCQNDNQCGDYNTMGCSFDSCCHARPSVESVSPALDQQNVCRNAVVSVTFNEKMDKSSLNNNFMLLAISPNSNCPAGTSHLALGTENNHLNIFALIYNRIIGIFRDVPSRIARALGLVNLTSALNFQYSSHDIDPTKTYCVTPGVTIYENTSQNTILKFTPSTVLQPSTDYVAVVKGQEILTSLASSTALGKAGVLNTYKVGMAGVGFSSFVSVSLTPFGPFGVNGPTFQNSYSWHFKTLSDNNATAGLCLIDRVDLTPSSYLFQKNTNDPLSENDSDSSNATFDTVADRDKLYVARALSGNGQELQPLPAYGWTWTWTIGDYSKINFTPGTDLVGTDNRQLLSVQTGITDAQVSVKAQTVMNSGQAYYTSSKNKEVPAQVFICSNPWPTVVNPEDWAPSRDTAGTNYGNYTYEFYYCRDAGDPNTTADDLPAISSGADIINLGLSTRKVCSNNRNTECTSDANCVSGGFCIPDILKESYFFQQ